MFVQKFIVDKHDDLPTLTRWEGDQVLVLVFGASRLEFTTNLIAHLRDHFPDGHILGCSTAGEIYHDKVHDETACVICIQFEHTKILSTCVALVDHENTSLAAIRAAQHLNKTPHGENLCGVFVLSDGLKVNGTHLVEGMNKTFNNKITITGGLAGDGPNFEETWTIVDDVPMDGHITAVGFYGDRLEYTHGSVGGWNPFGPVRNITKATDNILFELDDESALNIYKKYLGELATELPAAGLRFPLALSNNEDKTQYVVRTLLAIDEDAQSMTFAGNMPVGHKAQLMTAHLDRLVDGAENAAMIIANNLDMTRPGVLLATSCVGRKLVLASRVDEETEITLASVPTDTHQIGFYSYGEISPLGDGPSSLHNQTMTLTWLREN